MSVWERTTVKKYHCRRCGAMVSRPAVHWFAYGAPRDRLVQPAVALCGDCDARVAAVIDACLDGAHGEGDDE